MRISTFGLVAGLLLSTIASAQNVSCSLSGTVMDATGASLPDIEAVLTDSQTGFISKTRTNTNGFFSFASLTTGTFSLEIVAPGYRRYSENGRYKLGPDLLSLGRKVLETSEIRDLALPIMQRTLAAN